MSQLRLTSVSSSFPSLPFLSTFSANPGPGHRFRSKYHPDLTSRLQAEAQTSLFNRLKVFLFLTENGWFDNILMDIEQAPAIIKILDAGGILSLPDTIVATGAESVLSVSPVPQFENHFCGSLLRKIMKQIFRAILCLQL